MSGDGSVIDKGKEVRGWVAGRETTEMRMKGQRCRCTTWAGRERAASSNCSTLGDVSSLPFLTWGDHVLLHMGYLVMGYLRSDEPMNRKSRW